MSWSSAALGDVADIERQSVSPAEIRSGSRYVGLEHIESGGGSLSFGSVSNGDLASNKFQFGPNHILFGKLRPYLAKIVCPDFEGICSTDILPIAPRASIDKRYLLHFLRRPETVEWASTRATGINLPRLSPGELVSLDIPLPPLDEQRRIAAILDKADALRRKRKRAIELLDSLTQSIFFEMFGDGKRFESKTLVELIDPDDRINYGVVQPGDEDAEGTPLVRVSDLRNGQVDHTALKKISNAVNKQYDRSLLRGYEILISCVGSIGELAIATPREKGFNIARAVARVPVIDEVQRTFIVEFLRSATVQRYFTKELRTVSQPTLNIKQISETVIPTPAPKSMQEFHERSRLARSSFVSMQRCAVEADSLFSSLQSRAFSGQL